MAKLILGDFNAERFWENSESAKLPCVKMKESQRIVMAMEELQVLFGSSGDIIYTRGSMDDEWVKYLQYIGIYCENRFPSVQGYEYETSISEILCRDGDENGFLKGLEVDPFAVDMHMQEAVDKYRLSGRLPDADAVRKVNSKIYSSKMREYLGMKNYAVEVNNLTELENAFKIFGDKYEKILLKEEYGVSGQGNLLLQSENIADKVRMFIHKQILKGKNVKFIVEPFLAKAMDFSCQFSISLSGEYKLISVHEILNSGLSYKGSQNISGKMLIFLEKSGYFSDMERIAAKLYQDGYWGDVCVDSMLLEDGKIEPIIEINARKSMGLLKHSADIFMKKFGVVGALSFFNFYSEDMNSGFAHIADCLDKNGILFNIRNAKGIILLSEKAMHINKKENGYQGRIYFLSIGENEMMIETLMEEMKKILILLDYNLF